MGHTKATPENDRPTIAELALIEQQLFHKVLIPKKFVIRGNWTLHLPNEPAPEFFIDGCGHRSDIQELFASLKMNGNLENLTLQFKEETHD